MQNKYNGTRMRSSTEIFPLFIFWMTTLSPFWLRKRKCTELYTFNLVQPVIHSYKASGSPKLRKIVAIWYMTNSTLRQVRTSDFGNETTYWGVTDCAIGTIYFCAVRVTMHIRAMHRAFHWVTLLITQFKIDVASRGVINWEHMIGTSGSHIVRHSVFLTLSLLTKSYLKYNHSNKRSRFNLCILLQLCRVKRKVLKFDCDGEILKTDWYAAQGRNCFS